MPVICFRVDVAIGAGKFSKIGSVHVAIRALGPMPFVLTAVNREIFSVVLSVLRGYPARTGGMACGTIVTEIGLHVVGFLRRLKIWLMTGKTVVRCV